METTLQKLPVKCVLLSLAFFVGMNLLMPYTAHAQETTSDETVASTTASTTDVVVEAESEPEPWFRLGSVSGGRADMNDFVVGPGKIEVSMKPGETRVVEVIVTNRIDNNRRFKIEVEDAIGTIDASRAIQLLGGGERGPYSIQEFISIPGYEFTINLGQRAYIPVTISIPPNTEPGGYYGSVLVQTLHANNPDDNQSQVAPRSPVISRIGSLFFITVEGERNIGGSLSDFSLLDGKLWYEQGPVNFGILFENTATVHLNPYGELSITNLFGEEVGYIELEPWFVLPKALRLREVEWNREFLLGRYTATLKLNRGYDDIVDEATVHFWVLPWKIVVGTFAAVFTVLFLIRLFFRTFEFKRK